MPVNAPPITVDPYTSTIPLVQVPPEAIGGGQPATKPLQGNYTKAGGKMAIGDALMKGFLQGHALKEQKNYAQAQASLNAVQTGEQSAWKNYQDALTLGTAKPDKEDPLYKAYLEAHQRTTDVMSKYATPPKKTKGGAAQPSSGTTESGGKNDKVAAQKPMSFGEKIKDFFAANPHLVPQLALLSRVPNPPTMEPDTQANALKLSALQREDQQAAQAISDQNVIAVAYAREKDMTPDQKKVARAAMPETERKKLEEAEARRDERINEQQEVKGKYRYWTNGTDTIPLREGEAPPPGSGYHLVNERQQPVLKGEEAFKSDYIRQNGLDPKNMDPATDKYLHDWWQWKQAQTTSTTSGTTVDASGNRTTTGATTRGTPEPRPPAGTPPVGASAGQVQGGAQAGESPKTAGGLQPYPKQATAKAPVARGSATAGPPMSGFPAQAAAPGRTQRPMTYRDQDREDKRVNRVNAVKGKAIGKLNEEIQKATDVYEKNVNVDKWDAKTAGSSYGTKVWKAVTNAINLMKADGLKGQDLKDGIDAMGLGGDEYKHALQYAGIQEPESQSRQIPTQTGGQPPQTQQLAISHQPQAKGSEVSKGVVPPPQAGYPVGSQPTASTPPTIDELRSEMRAKKRTSEFVRGTGIPQMAETGKAIWGVDKRIIGKVGDYVTGALSKTAEVLSTLSSGKPTETHTYEINGNRYTISAQEAQDFLDAGYQVREHYVYQGREIWLTAKELEIAKQNGHEPNLYKSKAASQ